MEASFWEQPALSYLVRREGILQRFGLSGPHPCPVPVIVVPCGHFRAMKAISGLPALVGEKIR